MKKLLEEIKNMDKKIVKIIHKGLEVSLFICIIACINLITYDVIYKLPILYYVGISLIKSAFMFGCMFIICGISFNTIKKQIT